MKKHYLPIVFTIIIVFIQSLSTLAFPILHPMNLLSDQQNITINDRYDQLESRINPFSRLRLPSIPVYFLSSDIFSSPFFKPENLTLSDNAYHGSNQSYAVEWWYFDAILNQQYTIQFSVHIYDILSIGFAIVQCNIYNNGTPIISERVIKLLSSVSLSQHTPFIAIDDVPVMTYLGKTSDDLETYVISYSASHFSFNLTFNGTTKGWKGKTPAGDWAVIFPKALVEGVLTLNDTKRSVSGIGYHDHNWNVSISTGLNFGWIWGKISTEKHTFTWASIFETWFKQYPLLVINEDNDGYISIPPEKLDIEVTQLQFKNAMIIPYGFLISVHTKDFDLEFTITVLDTDYFTILGIINYWRYHVYITGTFKMNDHIETIQDHNIAEFIRFRPY
ncbi:MAG: hypothetical protein QCI00_03320 [Candidatus Thermoplasmatota archaeon]|nr:hypothetical protein [Candidatus Thermoplasmatota archaeon]